MAWHALAGRVPLLDGPDIAAYERRFGEVVGARHAFSFAAGRMGLYALLEALGIGPGDEVILPAFTCVVVPNAILYRGARPVWVDIDPRTYNIDPAKIEARITPRTRAIIVQHTFGLVCDVEPIQAIARQHHLVLLEDAAHALGATWRGQPVGSWSQAAFYSTDHSKVINTCAGGMVTTSDDTLARALATIQRRSPFLTETRARGIMASFISEAIWMHPFVYIIGTYLDSTYWKLGGSRAFFLDELNLEKPTAYPYPARLSNAQARIGLSQLDALPGNLTWRRHVARQFDGELRAYEGLLERDSANHVFLRYTFLVEDRAAWQRHFDDLLDMGIWFTSIAHGRTEGLDRIGYEVGSCPVAEFVTRHCVNLPTHLRIRSPERLARCLHAGRATLRVLDATGSPAGAAA